MHIDKRRVYRLPVAMNVARFIAFCGKLEYGRSGCIFAYISVTTRARDFKFAGTPVQRLQLAMVALTQKSFPAQYACFSRGGSHIHMYMYFVHCAVEMVSYVITVMELCMQLIPFLVKIGSLEIFLYYDDVEVCNPLGSIRTKHQT